MARVAAIFSVLAMSLPAQTARPRSVDTLPLTFNGTLTARSIGPAAVGGRVSSLAIEPHNATTFYVGAGMGGVFKTTDGGVSFQAIFEHEGVASIGDIAVSPSDPHVVWVGTGEANDRNTSTWGDGVYRSTDGGHSWKHAGLAASHVIGRIAVHPTDPRTAYVAAVGDLWQPSAERGLYKSVYAGATWKKVLGAPAPYDDRVGAGDVAIDPSNPEVVYATLYARRRHIWSFDAGEAATEGHDEGGIFKSEDGGATWHKLTSGLPAHTERIGLSVYARNPRVLYATVATSGTSDQGPTGPAVSESVTGGVFRSDDGGARWRRMSGLVNRPDYAGQVRVDPTTDARVYNLSASVVVSDDSGKTWREDISQLHPDHHALVIDPANPKHLISGNDGGVFQSWSGGATWDHLSKIAIGEFRAVNVDHSTPYRICGGLQDDGTWVGPSAVLNLVGIRNGDWHIAGMNDGAYCVFDPVDSEVLYWSTNNSLRRTDFRSGHNADVTPKPAATGGGGAAAATFTYNWTAPLIGSRHSPGVLFMGATRVMRLTDHAEHWAAISPDLTKPVAPGGRPTISTIAESPARAGVLWAGTDNGKLWRSLDDGAHWTDVSANLPASARGHAVNRVEASHADVSSAYVVVSAYRDGIFAPLVFATSDTGATWRDIAANLPRTEPARMLREDPDNANVLYLGTEYGIWITIDRGRSWTRLGDLPTVAVDDIAIEPKTHDLVIATQGRAFYIVDRARPLTEITRQVLSEQVHLFAPDPAAEIGYFDGLIEGAHGYQFRGENPPSGAVLTYNVGDAGSHREASVAIATAAGIPVANFAGTATPGLNRATWDLRPTRDMRANFQGTMGARYLVAPGKYTVTVTYEGAHSTQTIEVRAGPGPLTDYTREWPLDIKP